MYDAGSHLSNSQPKACLCKRQVILLRWQIQFLHPTFLSRGFSLTQANGLEQRSFAYQRLSKTTKFANIICICYCAAVIMILKTYLCLYSGREQEICQLGANKECNEGIRLMPASENAGIATRKRYAASITSRLSSAHAI